MSRGDAFDIDPKDLGQFVENHEMENSKTQSRGGAFNAKDLTGFAQSREMEHTKRADLKNPQEFEKQFDQLSTEDRMRAQELMLEDLNPEMMQQRIESLPPSERFDSYGGVARAYSPEGQAILGRYNLKPQIREELAMLPPKDAYDKVIQEREKVNEVTNRHIEAYNRNREPGTLPIDLPQGCDKLVLQRNMPLSQLEQQFPEEAKAFKEHGIAQFAGLVICAPGPTLCEEQEKLEQLGFVGLYNFPQNTIHHNKD